MATRTATRRVGKEKTKTRKASPRWWKWTKRFFVVGGTLFCIGGSVFGYYFHQAYQVAEAKISNLDELMQQVERSPSQIFSADGKLLYQVSSEYRKPVTYENVPVNVRNAVLAAEDKRFFDHPGVDVWALGRILFTTARDQKAVQGGSTLTMQLAKLLYTNSEKSLQRKIGDMAMALAIERKLTKEEILELYLNKVFFGSEAHGIQAAADVYFNKSIDKLTIGEAALLARCVRRPSDQNPFRNKEKAMENRNVVLNIMHQEGMITDEEYGKAKAEDYNFKRQSDAVAEKFVRSQYFVWHVLETLHKDFPDINLSAGGYKVYTTLDTTMQSVAEAAVRETVASYKGQGVTTAAFVAIDRDGRILCEVGGLDFKKNQFNVVTSGYRQPGSSFKPFCYATAFATGAVSISDSVSNARYSRDMPGGKPWTPKNSNGKYGGNVSIPSAFAWSMNVPMARVGEKTGENTILAFCRNNFGFTSQYLQAVPAMVLGSGEVTPLEMAQGYSTFMLRGNRAKPYCITRVVGPDGTVLKLYQPQITTNALDQHVADEIDALMRSVVTGGTGKRAGIVPNARGKTGTTSDNKDAWFCGYADGVVGIGWIANEVRREGRAPIYLPMNRSIFGGTVTVQFWAKVMKYAQKRFGKQMERPSMSAILRDSQPSEDPFPPDVPQEDPTQEDPPESDPAKDPTQLPGQPAAGPPGTTTGGTEPGVTPVPTTVPPATDPKKPATDPPVTRPPVRPPVDPPREENLTDVEICADTGMRSSIYCPETVTRRFARGQEPRRRCTKHGGQHR